MFPVNPDKPILYTDEKTGVIYSFRYLRDEDQEEFDRVAAIPQSVKKCKDEKKINAAYREYFRGLINLFLCGWTAKEPFPKSNPARYFIGAALGEMASLIGKRVPELIGLEPAEIKN